MIVHDRLLARMSRSASHRVSLEAGFKPVKMEVVETKTARLIPALSAASMMAGA
jgi:hypothetical protein